MTERTISLLVTLDQEYRVDDAEFVVSAIKMIKGVLQVNVLNSNYFEDHLTVRALKNQLKHEMLKKLDKLCE